ncbi:MAG: NAD-dependent epimerase [Rhodobacteraceae bacterium]|nr:MAG: NAD-dependent epimerase [Paracoccaceae bacterium]
MNFPDTLVLGATGRIGRLLQLSWDQPAGAARLLWQGRASVGLEQATHQVILDPLENPAGLTQAAMGRQILCLAGGIPGRGDLGDNWRLAEAALRAAPPGGRVILCSSAAVYGNQSGLLDETTPLRPANDYGKAKLEMEQRAAALAADLGIQLCVLRIGNIAGLDAILGGWRPGFQLDQFVDGSTPARSYIGVSTLAQALRGVLALPQLPAVVNLAQPGLVQMGALLDAAGLSWIARPAPEAAIARVALDTGVLQGLLQLPEAEVAQMVQQWRVLEPHITGKQEQV